MARVNTRIYNALIDVAEQASRFENRMYDAAKEGIRAAAESDDLSEFDSTVGYLEDTFRQRGDRVPIVIESMRLVVHQAKEKNIPLLDEHGNPRPLQALRNAIEGRDDKPERPQRRKKAPRRRVQKKR